MPRINSEKFYSASIEQYGTSAKGVHWISKETQDIRFEVILSMLPNYISSIVDAGCGFGDFYHYMSQHKTTCDNYIGIDSHFMMQKISLEKTSQKILLANVLKDPLPKSDYYICSGAMNILNNFETHLFIRNCFEHTSKAFVFNILHGDKQSNTYNYITTKQIQEIAKNLNVKKIEMRDDYLQNDITVGFFK